MCSSANRYLSAVSTDRRTAVRVSFDCKPADSAQTREKKVNVAAVSRAKGSFLRFRENVMLRLHRFGLVSLWIQLFSFLATTDSVSMNMKQVYLQMEEKEVSVERWLMRHVLDCLPINQLCFSFSHYVVSSKITRQFGNIHYKLII